MTWHESDFQRWSEPSDKPFYRDEGLTRAERAEAKQFWSNLAKEMTRGQLLQTAVDNRSISSPVYEAVTERLAALDKADYGKAQRAEFAPVMKAEAEYQRALKRHKKLLKAGKKSTRPRRKL